MSWLGKSDVLQSMHGVAESQTWLSNWTELNWWRYENSWTLGICIHSVGMVVNEEVESSVVKDEVEKDCWASNIKGFIS